MKDPVFATSWGGFRRAIHWKNNRGSMVEIQPTSFRAKLPVYLQMDNKKKDLIVFYPGIFAKPDGHLPPYVIDLLEKKDRHVAVIPNILAPTYLVSRPITSKIEEERINQSKILNDVLVRIGQKNISRIHIIAESLGTYQALSALYENNLSYDSLTLMWPPLYIDRALARFDKLISESIPYFNKCTFWPKLPFFLYEMKWQETPSLTQEEQKCLGSWVVSEFVVSIKETSEIYYNSRNLKAQVPVNFTEFMKFVLPEFNELIVTKNEKVSVPFLLKGIKNKNIKFVSSLDDFLNVPEEWDELKKNYDVTLFPWGGHAGPLGIEELSLQLIDKN
jgi:hypothetical protein